MWWPVIYYISLSIQFEKCLLISLGLPVESISFFMKLCVLTIFKVIIPCCYWLTHLLTGTKNLRTLIPEHNGSHCADETFKSIYWRVNNCMFYSNSIGFASMGSFQNESLSFEAMELLYSFGYDACFMLTSSNGSFFSRYRPFVWDVHRSPVNSPHKGPVTRTLMFLRCGSP